MLRHQPTVEEAGKIRPTVIYFGLQLLLLLLWYKKVIERCKALSRRRGGRVYRHGRMDPDGARGGVRVSAADII